MDSSLPHQQLNARGEYTQPSCNPSSRSSPPFLSFPYPTLNYMIGHIIYDAITMQGSWGSRYRRASGGRTSCDAGRYFKCPYSHPPEPIGRGSVEYALLCNATPPPPPLLSFLCLLTMSFFLTPSPETPKL